MPQLNKGGKFVFGFSVVRDDLTIHIPPRHCLNMMLHGTIRLLFLQEVK